MKIWRPSLSPLAQVPLTRAALALGVGGTAVCGYAGLSYLGGTIPFAQAMNLPAALAIMPDPLSIMTARSPGERASGAMFNTKPAKQSHRQLARNSAGKPHERVLSTVRERAPADTVPTIATDTAPAFVPEVAVPPTQSVLGPLPEGVSTGFTPLPTQPGTPGVGIVPVLPGATPTPTPTPTTPAPAVPEPATWAMMTLGFAMTGFAVRRRSRKRAQAA